MKPLDSMTARTFPALASYAHKLQRRAHFLGYGFASLAGVAVEEVEVPVNRG